MVAGLSLIGSAVTLRDRPWIEVLVFAALIAAVTSVAILGAASPSTSRSCSAKTDCDTSFGLGLPILAAALFIPLACIGFLGRLVSVAFRHKV